MLMNASVDATRIHAPSRLDRLGGANQIACADVGR